MDDPLDRALAFLPHGPEFRFVQRLRNLEPGKSGSGEYQIQGSEPFLRGHFPGQPLFPGVLMVEGSAQLAGVVAQSDPAIAPLSGLRLTALRNIKILGSAKPGDVLRFEARLTGRLANLIQADVAVYFEDRLLMQGAVTLSGENPVK